jgi:hypothetical protein
MVTLQFVWKIEAWRRCRVDDFGAQLQIGSQGWRDEMRRGWLGWGERVQMIIKLKGTFCEPGGEISRTNLPVGEGRLAAVGSTPVLGRTLVEIGDSTTCRMNSRRAEKG